MGRANSPLRDRLVLVVGAERSGTNWLQRMLAAHPEVAAVPGETALFGHGLRTLADNFQHGAIGSPRIGTLYMDRQDLLDALRDFCDSVFAGLLERLGPGSRYLVERTPHHVRYLDLIGDLYPDARVVHIIRDGRDVVRSLASQTWGPTTIRDAASEWHASVTAGRTAGACLMHYTEVRYEEMLRDTRAEMARLYRWLDLDTCDDVLAGALLEGGVPDNVDSLCPRVGSGKWKESFTPVDLAEFVHVAGPLLFELGYDEAGCDRVSPAGTRMAGIVEWKTAKRSLQLLRRWSGDRRERQSRRRDRQVLEELHSSALLVNRLLDLIVVGPITEARELFDQAAKARIVAPEGIWEGRGVAATDRLLGVLAADPALRGTQTIGDVHPAVPTFVVVMRYRLADDLPAHRVLAITIGAGRITDLAYYRLDATGLGPNR